MKLAYLLSAVVLFSVPASAQKIDKAKMLEVTRRDCPAQSMQNKSFIDALLIGGGELAKYCECLAVRFASQLDDTDYGNEKTTTAKWVASQKFCLAASIK
jgi:hypothetical protein